jgi:drug/metabolite transporter (DMT)-like permease
MKSVYLKLIAVAFLWGGTFIAGRIAAQFLSPLTGAALRFAFATLCFVALLTITKSWQKISLPTLGIITLMGLSGVAAYNYFFFQGLSHIPASRAALVIATNPICSLIAAHFFYKEPLSRRSILGIIIALCGAIVVITQGQLDHLWNGTLGMGEVIIFGCVISWVTYTMLSKKIMGDKIIGAVSPLIASSYSVMMGCTVLIALAFAQNGTAQVMQEMIALPFKAWVALAFLGIFGTVIGFKWFLDGVNVIGPAKAAIFINLVPVFAVVLGITILGESLNLATFLGGMCVIGGIAITLFKPNTHDTHANHQTAQR